MNVGTKRHAVALACALLFASGCGAAPSVPPESATAVATASPTPAIATSGTQHVVAGPISLDAPAGWHVRPGVIIPSGNFAFDYLSPVELPSECTQTSQGGECHPWPILQLAPGGIIVAVRLHGMPRSQPPDGGDPMTVAALPARRLSGPADTACQEIGGSELTEVVLPPVPGGWMSLDACLAGGDTSAADAALASILASVTMGGDAASP